MTEQEAKAEAEALLKPLVERLRCQTSVGYIEKSYVEYWAAVKAFTESERARHVPVEVEKGEVAPDVDA